VKGAAASGPDARRTGRIRFVGIAVLAALAAVIGSDAAFTSWLREAWFDACQALAPRIPKSAPAVVVEIDEKSLKAIGQWPWPRSVMAELVEAVHGHRPAAIALDILMPEVDASSPERLLARAQKKDAALAAALAHRPPNDALLASALAGSNAVLAIAGMTGTTGMPLRAPPFTVHDARGADAAAAKRSLGLAHYPGALTSIDALDRAAAGRGLISVDPEGGVVRRIPLVASIDGTLVPALAIEILRTAIAAPSVRLIVSGSKVEGVATGDLAVPTEADGAVRIYYSRRMPGRFVSAIDVLEGKVDPERLGRKLVLIGLTGIGLLEYQNTPIGDRMPGSEIHAQLLENLYDETLLRRPAYAPGLETILFVLLGSALIYATPRWRAGSAAVLLIVSVAILALASFAAFRAERLLFDAATPAVGLSLLFGVLLVSTLAEATRQRKLLERAVADERERNARIAGELEAARRIQTATLPRADLMASDPRIDIGASMVPARETGGDLYDYFLLDDRRFFFLAGDVAGKGLSASIFMAVSKALYKSATLRAQTTDIGLLMSAANAEVSRDNPQMLFVTAFAGILDLETGELEYCNAGHENPFLIDPPNPGVRRIEDGDGPPLCAVSDYAYEGARCILRAGEFICVVTDGVTEAMNRSSELYGSARVLEILPQLATADARALDVVKGLRADVDAFAAGAEPADDLTILALRWRGPAASAG
jgi:serine phosphatase RsbU (regulator of sigma subunit)/CHASE2 domain-containing sensor protein